MSVCLLFAWFMQAPASMVWHTNASSITDKASFSLKLLASLPAFLLQCPNTHTHIMYGFITVTHHVWLPLQDLLSPGATTAAEVPSYIVAGGASTQEISDHEVTSSRSQSYTATFSAISDHSPSQSQSQPMTEAVPSTDLSRSQTRSQQITEELSLSAPVATTTMRDTAAVGTTGGLSMSAGPVSGSTQGVPSMVQSANRPASMVADMRASPAGVVQAQLIESCA